MDNPFKEDDASELAKELFSGKLGVGEALAKLRTRLLDLSMRNRLLNYRHPKGRSFQFTDNPDLDLLFERLEDGKSVPLQYVPEPPASRYEGGKKPEARIYARETGIGTAVDIGPSEGSTAHKRLYGLQVLYYPVELESLARKVSSEAHTVVEETGTNMLYLIFGFLEYFDSDDSDKAALAPLLSMPVNLLRGHVDPDSRSYIYELSHSGEDIAENFTLREKLRQQFRLELPDLGEEDSPEVYFAKIEKAVSTRRRWSVKRRLSLGFLSFGKLAIWADLDPAKADNLLTSPLLKDIFEGGRHESSEAFHAEDYDIDSHADGELPLIYDADSSQHSAIIDVKSGKSLVINGPPGTGKSQTITNIVAAAIADGKKVLFVSEKLAALEVVKQRLEAAGLGDFCLELHSHKTQKKQLLESIEQRMSRRFAAPPGYAKRIDVLRERRNGLNTYAELLGSKLAGQSEQTVHEVFWTTERMRQSIGEELDAVAGLAIRDAAEWSPSKYDKCRMTLNDAASALVDLGCSPTESPWKGFVPQLLIKGDEVPIVRALTQALEQAHKMTRGCEQVEQLFQTDPWSIQQLTTAANAISEVDLSVPVDGRLLERMFADGLGSICSAKADAQRLASMLIRIRESRRAARASLVFQKTWEAGAVQPNDFAIPSCLDGRAQSRSVAELDSLVARFEALLENLAEKSKHRSIVVPPGPELVQASLEAAGANPLTVGWSRTPARQLQEMGTNAVRVVRDVSHALDQVSDVLRASHVQFSGRVDELQALLDGRGMPELLPNLPPGEEALIELRGLAASGWQDWTAEQFSSKAREIGELLAEAAQASEELSAFFARIGLAIDLTRASLESVEVLLSVAESAPLELLPLRSPGLDRPDFVDVAIRAEDALKSVEYKAAKVLPLFHLDTLPGDDELKEYVRVFRRGDSIFNVFRGDWRRAKLAYIGCARSKAKVNAGGMGERFAAVVAWNTAKAEFLGNTSFSATLGPLFNGLDTDFSRTKRLSAWVRSAATALLATEFGNEVKANSVPEHHVSLLSSNASRVRGWIGRLQQLSQAVLTLPGLDPALMKVRRIDELFNPLEQYVGALKAGNGLLKSLVRPVASVGRAIELVELKRRIGEHGDLLRWLVESPKQLVSVGVPLGMPSSGLSYQDLSASLAELNSRASAAVELGDLVCLNSGMDESVQSALEVLVALNQCKACAGEFLAQSESPKQGLCDDVFMSWQAQTSEVRRLVQTLLPYAKPAVSVADSVAGLHAQLDADYVLQKIEYDAGLLSRFGDHLRGEDTDEAEIVACLNWAQIVRDFSPKLPGNAGFRLLKIDGIEAAGAVKPMLGEAKQAFEAYKAAMASLSNWGKLDWQAWGGYPTPNDAVARLETAIAGSGALIPWSKYLAASEDASAVGVAELVHAAATGKLAAPTLVRAFEYVFYRSLSRGILATHKELGRFSGTGHEQLRTEFAQLDKELIALNGAMYASKVDAAKKPLAGVSTGRVGDLTEMGLLTKEMKKQKRHVPIRQLMRRAGRSLQELKPCFMMGPLSVAQYLEQGHLSFDLVVMDEASQLRPEDALGAIARGKQLVVVGDPKQLPPTNFFGRLMDDDDEDPEDGHSVVDGVESILGICEHLYRPVRTLRWHYRSRHESLIAFSNSQFYDGRLVVFPSPYDRNKRLGVNYRYVREGSYQDRRNIPEAERVVNAVVEHMLTRPEESLGVVTLNQTQRELIEDMLDKKVRNLTGVAVYLDRHEKAGWKFFVKNLENVQGDERDVIFVSTTFGPPPGQKAVRQHFGPINRPDGWRRLNVLFTRARRRLDLFTSMLPSDVQVDEKASLGRRALQQYLEYAKTGVLPNVRGIATERDADSDFEVAVADALRFKGFKCEPQVGVAGYFIDLGVRHPGRKSEFLAGIECDGVNYHSSLSARDRDRIRQEILESLGWHGRIIRVWSTDWFADPAGQTDRLVQFLNGRLADDQSQPTPFTDEDLEDEEVAPLPEDDSEAFVEDEPSSSDSQRGTEAVEPAVFVEIGDRVTYETTVEPIERHTVQIVDSASNLKLGLLNDQTPLAQALLGLCADDEAELVLKGQPTRKMRILAVARGTSHAI